MFSRPPLQPGLFTRTFEAANGRPQAYKTYLPPGKKEPRLWEETGRLHKSDLTNLASYFQ